MHKLLIIGLIALALFASGCDVDLLEDHDHDGDGVQDHVAEDHDDHSDDHAGGDDHNESAV